jgi:hypothetical protein
MEMKSILEAQRETPVVAGSDVFVAGGGPAGVVAALAAARTGADVVLVDAAGCLGGTWTAGLLCLVHGSENKGGILTQLTDRLDDLGALISGQSWVYDPEIMKLLLEQMCLEAGVKVQLHTNVVAARRDGRRLTHVITESASGREAWEAKAYIDCTGDGTLGARAGCCFDMGRDEDGGVQPMSLPCLLTGVDPQAVQEYLAWNASPGGRRRFSQLCSDLGVPPSYPKPMFVRIHDNLYSLICDHQHEHRCDDAAAITAATIQARREVNDIVNALRASGGIWSNLRVVATCEHIGVREGRRIHGLHTISIEDVISGHVTEDSFAICRFGIDVHSVKRDAQRVQDVSVNAKAQPYGLPLGSLIARDVDGLMMAGRCISGDFLSHSSYRVTGDAAAMGQAAGLCAALAARDGLSPAQVPFSEVKAGLEALGAAVP